MTEVDGHPLRKRARQACVACNTRRVKCNVTEQRPCQNCVVANVSCETRESRRGKHPRPSKKHRPNGDVGHVKAEDDAQGDDEVAASHVLASLHKNQGINGFGARPSTPPSSSSLNKRLPVSPDDLPNEDDGAVFLGESTSLRYVHEDTHPGNTPKLTPQSSMRMRHAVPSAVKADALIPQWEAERRRARIELLKSEGAFSLPPQPVLEELLNAYFRWFHPCFAIVDEPDVRNQLRQGTLSPLLLQAILFVGVIHCEETVLHQLGLDNRHKAKYIFYNRVKDIYDAEFEPKKLTVIQSLFLMSFWRAGALLEKDARHWLGAAITLAETKALHRSAGRGGSQSVSLRKRLWWSLYTRERQCAAALGLPNRVRDEDCDIEPLERSDFENAFIENIAPSLTSQYVSYAMGMAEVAQLLGKIVLGGYLPNRSLSTSQRSQMKDDLHAWKQRLPADMECSSDPADSNFYANMLQLAYNNLLILLYRPGFIGGELDGQNVDGNLTLQAAARNSTIIENMLAEGNLRHAPIHVITNLFNTLCVHTLHMRRSDGTARTVAEHRAKLCLLGLKELQRTWELKNWLLKLFFKYLDHSTAARLWVERDDDSAIPTAFSSMRTSQEPGLPDQNGMAPMALPAGQAVCDPNGLGMLVNPTADATSVPTSLSWTTEEANEFLFSQIENEFAFGEGGMLNWSPDNTAFGDSTYTNVMF